MTPLARATSAFLAALALSGLGACKSPAETASTANTGASGAAGVSDSGGGAASLGGAEEPAGNAGEVGQGGDAAQAGATAGGATGAAVSRGLILVTQATHHSAALMQDTANSNLSVIFSARAQASGAVDTTSVTTVGDCTASIVNVDPNATPVTPPSGLNAGTIAVTGTGVPTTYSADYLDNGSKGPSNYGRAGADTRFYEDGDVLSVRGMGGPDLPAFAVQTLTAPSEIALTAPTCVTGVCPDVDRTRDLLVEWQNGGAGKVDVLFETIANSKVVLLECKFDASTGKGVVPASLLAKLDVVDGVNVSGIEQISPIAEKTFLVGDVSTTFSIRTAQFEALLEAAN